MRTANLSETEKSSSISNALEHLRVVKLERSHYKSICEECKESVRAHFVIDGKFAPPPPSSRIPCNSNNIKVHYSFDFAQQIHYPSDPLQPGPIYLASTVKPFPVRSTSLRMKRVIVGKAPTLLSVGSTSFLRSMDSGRRTCTCMQIIVLGRTRIIVRGSI